jgi:hypothetical protein
LIIRTDVDPFLSLENSLQSLLLDSATYVQVGTDLEKVGTDLEEIGTDLGKVSNRTPSPRRRADIYVGVDVFGRGCLGGGGKGNKHACILTIDPDLEFVEPGTIRIITIKTETVMIFVIVTAIFF